MGKYFIGIQPPIRIIEEIIHFQSQFPNNLLSFQSIPHITLLSPAGIKGMNWLEKIEEVCHHFSPFEITLKTPQCFGDQVVYLSVDSKEVFDLHCQMAQKFPSSLEERKERFELNHYTPHLTLGTAEKGLSKEEIIEIKEKAKQEFSPAIIFEATGIHIYHKKTGSSMWNEHLYLPFKK